MDLKAILDGHTNEFLGLNKDASINRLKICNKCPLFKKTLLGPICNNKIWIDTETGDISTTKKDNYKHGCGCRLEAKTTLLNATCPINKW